MGKVDYRPNILQIYVFFAVVAHIFQVSNSNWF